MIETIPANHEAEKVVLGAIILDNERFYEASAELRPAHFQLDSHRKIFARMHDLSAMGRPIDLVTLSAALGDHNELKSVGGAGYISSLLDGVPHLPTIQEYVGMLVDKCRRRDFLTAMNQGLTQVQDSSEPTDKCFAVVQEALLDIEAESNKTQARHVAQFSNEVLNNLIQMNKATGEVIGLSTGLDSLDADTTGIRAGELWVLGGRPGEGKSSLAIQAAAANTNKGIPVAFFSIEMSRDQVLMRLWAAESGIDAWKLRDPRRMSPEEWARLKSAALRAADQPLFVDDSGNLTVTELAARARLLVKRQGVRLIVVDYVQILDADGKDERQRVSKISKALRLLAKEQQVGVLALSQMSRPRDGSLNRRPTKFDLKESGALEADANTVLLIYRPVDEFNEFTGLDELIIGKQRNGPVKSIDVTYLAQSLEYRERAGR